MNNDALNFVTNNLGFVQGSHVVSNGERFYRKTNDRGPGSLYVIVHFENNGEPHLHLHCYVNGNNDLFTLSNLDAINKNKPFTPESDLFGSPGSIGMTLDHFINMINKI